MRRFMKNIQPLTDNYLNMEEQRTDFIHDFITGVICSNLV